MPKLTNEQLSAIHAAKKAGITKGGLFKTEVERRRIEREGGVDVRGLGFVRQIPHKDMSFDEYVKAVRRNQEFLETKFKDKPKIVADRMIMEEMLIRHPELKREFLRHPRITEQELEKLR